VADVVVHKAQPPGFAHQFEDMDQQRDADSLGMWVFLVTEIMFFGGLFASYIVYRSLFLDAFEIGSRLLKVDFGAVNTAILIGSSLTMALAIHAAQAGKRKSEQITFLVLTMILGALFLFLKFNFEWRADYTEHLIPGFGFIIHQEWGAAGSHVPMFFLFYFFMTGLHALHMIIGIGILIVLTVMANRNRFNAEYYAPLEVTGLYWHFVDIVWIFLFPLLYLIGGRYAMAGGH
jgi:cytochrome c oxidase subunit III